MSKGAPKIRFEDLDDDDGRVDPLELDDGSFSDDPRAGDPFRDEPGEDAGDDELDVEVEPDDDPDDDPGGAAAAQPQKEEAPADDELAQLRARLAELEREREQSRRDADEAQKSLHEARAQKIDEDLKAARASLKTAIEEGDTDKQVELQDRLAQLHADKRELGAAPKQQQSASPDMPRVEARNQAAATWMRGKAWINNPAHAEQNKDLIRIAGVLVEDGFNPNLAEYYEELDRRMKRRHPVLYPSAAKPPVQRKPAQQTVGRVTHDNPPKTGVSSKRRVVLTQEDKRNMLRFNLDPSNPEHLREYARNKETDRVVA